MGDDQRGDDRRTGQPGYEGEERRVGDRRAAGTDARAPVDMSDDDLLSAARQAGSIGQARADQIRAELVRRNLKG